MSTVDNSTRPAIARKALDALTIVEAADLTGLPLPYNVTFSEHRLELLVDTLDEFNTWVERLSTDASVTFAGPKSDRVYSANGELVGIPVRVSCVVTR